MALTINKRDYQLSNGEIIEIGMNFRALELMSRYPGGLTRLNNDMTHYAAFDPESDEYGEVLPIALGAMGYMLWALIRAAGVECTVEEVEMAIGGGDFEQLMMIFDEFYEQMERMAPNGVRRALNNR